MLVKKFEAASMEEALSLVKRELGPNALILASQQRTGKWFQKPWVEVTAAFEKKEEKVEDADEVFDEQLLMQVFPHRKGSARPSVQDTPNAGSVKGSPGLNRYLQMNGEGASASPPAIAAQPKAVKATGQTTVSAETSKRNTNRNLEQYEGDFIALGFGSDNARELSRRLVFDYARSDLQNPSFLRKAKTKLVATSLTTLGPDVFTSGAAWAAIGSAGVGKTSLLVKLALHLKSKKRPVQLISGDKRKVTGFGEMAAYSRLIKIPFAVDNAPGPNQSAKIQLVDTPALSASDQEDNESVRRLSEGRKTVLVLDPCMRFSEIMRLVDRASLFSPQAVAFTRIDQLESYGVIFDVMKATRLPLLGISLSRSFSAPFKFFESVELALFLLERSGVAE